MFSASSRRRIIVSGLLVLICASVVEISSRNPQVLPGNDALLVKDANDGRSNYGYRRPRPPFAPIRHTSHNCSVPSASGQYARKVHLPITIPNLIVIGAQKSGTSTLQTIFRRQGLTSPGAKTHRIVGPTRKRPVEPHFFDWDVLHKRQQSFNRSESDLCQLREAYSQYFDTSLIQPNASVVFEKTPSYMLYQSIPSAIDAVCPWGPKILVALRNPVDRAWSQYQMMGQKYAPAKAFMKMVNDEIRHLKRSGLLASARTVEEFERSDGSNPFRFPANQTLRDCARRVREYTGSRLQGVLYRGLYAPLLLPWVEQFASDDRMMVLHFEAFARAENEGNKTIVDEVLGFAGMVDASEDGDANRRMLTHHESRRRLVWVHKNQYNPVPIRIRQYLSFLYEPFNKFLVDLLGESWRGVWED